MKILSVFLKNFRETIRDWKMLVLTLAFGPLFLLVFYFMFHQSANYKIIIENKDKGFIAQNYTKQYLSKQLISDLKTTPISKDGTKLTVLITKNHQYGIKLLKQQSAQAMMEISKDFSDTLEKQKMGSKKKSTIKLYGDLTNQMYMRPAIFSQAIVENFINKQTGIEKSYNLVEKPIIKMDNISDFNYYIPIAPILGWIMILFTAATAVMKEIDNGTIDRIKLSKLKTHQLLIGININQIIIGLIAIYSTIGLAYFFMDFRMNGSPIAFFTVSLISTFSLVGVAFIVTGFCKTAADIMIIGNLPYFLILIFCGIFPMPKISLINTGKINFTLSDIFSPTYMLDAYKKIIFQKAGLGDVTYEITAILVLTVIYFAIGIWLFNRKHLAEK